MNLRWTAPLLAVALAGCFSSTPQYRYFTLDMTSGAELSSPVALDGVRVRVNEALARPEILIRVSSTQVEYYALDRWASGLEEQVTEKLKTEFANPQSNPYRARIDAVLMAFEQVDTPEGPHVRVKLETTVDVSGRGIAAKTPPFNRIYSRTDPAGAATPAAVVEALSRSLEAIAADIAADVENYAQSQSGQPAAG